MAVSPEVTQPTLNQYEAMFLLPGAAGSDVEGAIKLVRTMLEHQHGQVLVIKKWDERKLSYELGRQKRGLFIIAYFKAHGAAMGGHRARRKSQRRGPPRDDHPRRSPERDRDGCRRAPAHPAARRAQSLGSSAPSVIAPVTTVLRVTTGRPRDDRAPRGSSARPARTTSPPPRRRIDHNSTNKVTYGRFQ